MPIGFKQALHHRALQLGEDTTYNHWQIDGEHTSFVTLPLWVIGACLGL